MVALIYFLCRKKSINSLLINEKVIALTHVSVFSAANLPLLVYHLWISRLSGNIDQHVLSQLLPIAPQWCTFCQKFFFWHKHKIQVNSDKNPIKIMHTLISFYCFPLFNGFTFVFSWMGCLSCCSSVFSSISLTCLLAWQIAVRLMMRKSRISHKVRREAPSSRPTEWTIYTSVCSCKYILLIQVQTSSKNNHVKHVLQYPKWVMGSFLTLLHPF